MLYENIKKDQRTARLKRQTDLASLLTTLLGEIQTQVVSTVSKEDLAKDLVPDAPVIKVLNFFIKNAKKCFETTNNDAYLVEISILEKYLPKLVSEEDLKAAIQQVIEESTEKLNVGIVFKQLENKLDGGYDKKLASTIINQLLKG